MNEEINVFDTLVYLIQTTDIKMPYGYYPNYDLPGIDWWCNQERWEESWRWNPENTYYKNPIPDPDPNASPKPTWQEMLDAYTAYKLIDRRTICLGLAYQAATQRIALLYHPKAVEQPEREWQVRLSGEDVSAMDEKRVGLISVYDTLKARIENGTTVAEFDAIEADIISDLTWSTEKSNG